MARRILEGIGEGHAVKNPWPIFWRTIGTPLWNFDAWLGRMAAFLLDKGRHSYSAKIHKSHDQRWDNSSWQTQHQGTRFLLPLNSSRSNSRSLMLVLEENKSSNFPSPPPKVFSKIGSAAWLLHCHLQVFIRKRHSRTTAAMPSLPNCCYCLDQGLQKIGTIRDTLLNYNTYNR